MDRIEVILDHEHAPAERRFFSGAIGNFRLGAAPAVVGSIARF
jgi:hypothetical protein